MFCQAVKILLGLVYRCEAWPLELIIRGSRDSYLAIRRPEFSLFHQIGFSSQVS